MDVSIDVRELLESPAFSTPDRLGVFIYLAALASPKNDLKFSLRPVDLSDRLNTTKTKIETAISTLASLDVIKLEKKTGKRGVWSIDLSPSAHLLHGEWAMAAPELVPVRDMMLAWDKLFHTTTGANYLRAQHDFWRERKDWITLYDSMGDGVYEAMKLYFQDKKNSTWAYRFTVFFKEAPQLTKKSSTSGWRY